MSSSLPDPLLPAWPAEDARCSLAQLQEYGKSVSTAAGTQATPDVQSLVKQGVVENRGGRWCLTDRGKAMWRQHPEVRQKQAEARTQTPRSPNLGPLGESAAVRQDSSGSSPWDTFRRAVRYYIECVRLDERPSCALYADRKDQEFVFAYVTQRWWPDKPSEKPPILRIPLGPAQAPFVRKAISENENQGLYVGYPLEVARIPQDGKATTLLRPVCCIPVVVEDYDDKSISLCLNFDELDINSDWLQRGLSRDQQGAFLTASGMAPGDDDSPDLPSVQR